MAIRQTTLTTHAPVHDGDNLKKTRPMIRARTLTMAPAMCQDIAPRVTTRTAGPRRGRRLRLAAAAAAVLAVTRAAVEEGAAAAVAATPQVATAVAQPTLRVAAVTQLRLRLTPALAQPTLRVAAAVTRRQAAAHQVGA